MARDLRTRWIGALAALGVVAALTAPAVLVDPAPAAADTAVSFSAPASDGTIFTATAVRLAGNVFAGSGTVTSVVVTVTAAAGPVTTATLVPTSPGPSYTWSWTPVLDVNGRYTANAVATVVVAPGAPAAQAAATVTFILNAPPVAPTGLTSALDPRTRAVTLTWAANPEPDVSGYLVLRAAPGGALKPLNIVAAPAHGYRDAEVGSEPAGMWRYAVVALRPGWQSGTVPSPQSLTATVSIATPPGRGATRISPAARPATRPAPAAAPAVAPAVPAPALAPAVPAPGVTPGLPAPAVAPAAPAPGVTPGLPAPGVATGPTAATTPSTRAAPLPASTHAAPPARRRGPSRKTAYEVLDALLIIGVVVLLAAVRRDRGHPPAPLEPLEPGLILDGTLTVGEALARRAPKTAEPAGRG